MQTTMLSGVVGDDGAIEVIRAQAARLVGAERLPPVLIEGETGTGKTLLARELHAASARAGAAFVSVNCAAIPESLLEAELFGSERGAFTDAREAKPGLVQTAHRGVLFLDEIGYLPLRLQPKLLTVLEEWKVRRLGGTRAEPVDVWLIAATSEDLQLAIAEQRFLRALYHRLAVVTFRVPALRERAADVPRIAEQLLLRACRAYGLPRKRLTDDAAAELRRRAWPGNVRELGNVIERAALLADGVEVTAAMLGAPASTPRAADGATVAGRYRKKSDDERADLERALRDAQGNISEAARLLGLPRNTLRYRLRRHGLASEVTPPAAPLAPSPASPRPAATPPRWEKQKVAFLNGSLEPADAAWSSAWLDVLDEKVELFGGRVLEHDGLRLTAVFGLDAVEDAARRAVLAALTTLQGAPNGVEPDRLALAVDVDEIAVARADDEVIVGPDAVARARAFARGHRGSGIRVGDAAAHALRRSFRIVARDGQSWIEPDHSAPSGAYAGALVGREGELLLLRARAEAAAAGAGQVVGIVGPPGIGKSRLVHELRLGLAPGRFAIIDARCSAHASRFAYQPIAALVRGLAGLAPGASAAAERDALRALASEDAVPVLLHVLGVDDASGSLGALAAETLRARAFAAVRELFIRAAAVRPLVVIVEDVHWADRLSRGLLEQLIDAIGRAPLLLLVTYRPEDEPAFMARPLATRIALARLSAEESRGLLGAVLPGQVGAPVLDGIVERAEGNPLFLEELALAVRNGDALQSVPDSLYGILRLRMERLRAPERRLLRVASVVGREVPDSLLAALWDGPEPLEPICEALDRADLLHSKPGARVFKHALTHDVAYEAIVDSERSRLHERAARALEAAHRDDPSEACELIAYHYARGDDRDKAVEYLARAQLKTYRRFALDEAVRYFQEASARLATLPDTEANLRRRIELLIRHCDTIGYLTRLEEYRHHLELAFELAGRLGDPAVIAAVRSRRGFLFWWTGEFHATIAELEPHLRFAPESTADEHNSGVWLLNAYLVVGRYASLLALAPRVLERLVARGSVIHRAYAHGCWTWALAECGRFADALREADANMAQADASRDPAAVAFAAWAGSWVHAQAGSFARAEELAELAVRTAVTPMDQIFSRLTRGWVASRTGRGEAVLGEMIATTAAARASHWPTAGTWCAVSDVFCSLARWDDARRSIAELLELAEPRGMRATVAGLHRRMGEVVMELGDLAGARAWLDRALSVLEEIGAEHERALTVAALGELTVRDGDVAAGRRLLGDALAALESMGAAADAANVRRRLPAIDG